MSYNFKDYEDELPVIMDKNDKIRVIKGILLLLLFSSIVIFTLIFNNCPTYNANLLISNENSNQFEIITNSELFLYQVNSKKIYKNLIELKMTILKNNLLIDNGENFINDIIVRIYLSKNRVRLKIIPLDNNISFIDSEKFFNEDNADILLEKDDLINNIYESLIGVDINTFPFGLKIYRKENEEILMNIQQNIFDSNSKLKFYFKKNEISFSAKIAENIEFLGPNLNTNLSLEKSEFKYWVDYSKNYNLVNESIYLNNQADESFLSTSGFFIKNKNLNSYYYLSSFISYPMEISFNKTENELSFKILGNYFDCFIFGGPSIKNIILETYKTFGYPYLPKITDLDWQLNVCIFDQNELGNSTENIIKEINKSIFPFKDIWLSFNNNDEYNNLTFLYNFKNTQKEKDMNSTKIGKANLNIVFTPSYDFKKGDPQLCLKENDNILYTNKNKTLCLLNFSDKNKYEYLTKYLSEESHKITINHSFLEVPISYPWNKKNFQIDLRKLEIYFDNQLVSYEDINNWYLYFLFQKIYERGQIISNYFNFGGISYFIKSLGSFINSEKDYISDLLQYTYFYNMQGITNLLLEFPLIKDKKSFSQNEKEIFINWLYLSIIFPYIRINNISIINSLSKEDELFSYHLKNCIRLRKMISLYLYILLVLNNIDGSFYILPFYEFYQNDELTINYENIRNNFSNQFLLGPNLLIFSIGDKLPLENETISNKILLPKGEKYYNFYTLECFKDEDHETVKELLISQKSERILMLIRGGYSIPLFDIDEDSEMLLIKEIENNYLKLIIALNENYYSQGEIVFDLQDESEIKNKKERFYILDFITNYNSNSNCIEILFRQRTHLTSKKVKYLKEINILGIEYEPKSAEILEIEEKNRTTIIQKKDITFNKSKKLITITLINDSSKLVNIISPKSFKLSVEFY